MAQMKSYGNLRESAVNLLKARLNNPDYSDKSLEEVCQELELHKIELEMQNETLLTTQTELEESRNNFLQLYDFAPIGYFTLDQQGLIIEVNRAGSALFGIQKKALLNQCFSRYCAPESQHAFSSFRQKIEDSSSALTCELKMLNKQGPIFIARVYVKKITDANHMSSRLLVAVTDITSQKQQEVDLHQNRNQLAYFERESSMAELAATIMHELNHPHGVISNYIHGCIRRIESGKYDPQELLKAMTQASEQLNRVSEVILRMKNFSCKGIIHQELVCLNSTIKDTLALIDFEADTFGVKVRYRPAPGSLQMRLDKIHIQQVILNLARNAIEAMRDAGTVDPQIIIEANHIQKNMIEINIIDNGPGIYADHVHQLFDPYYTTKAYGTGMGLAISRTLVEAHNGKIWVDLSVNQGACVKFTLPIKEDKH